MFLTKIPPQPQLVLYKNGKSLKKPYLKQNDTIEIRVIPEANFAAKMPNEVNYVITTIKLYPMSGHYYFPILAKKEIENGIILPVSSLNIQKYGSGMLFHLECDSIYRVNSLGERIMEKRMNWSEKTLSFSIY